MHAQGWIREVNGLAAPIIRTTSLPVCPYIPASHVRMGYVGAFCKLGIPLSKHPNVSSDTLCARAAVTTPLPPPRIPRHELGNSPDLVPVATVDLQRNGSWQAVAYSSGPESPETFSKDIGAVWTCFCRVRLEDGRGALKSHRGPIDQPWQNMSNKWFPASSKPAVP